MATPADETGSSPRRWLGPALTLAIIGIVLTAALAVIAAATRGRIERNEQAALALRLDALVAADTHDNDLLSDRMEVVAPDLLGTTRPVAVYRARRGGKPVAAVLRPVAPDGYRGPIELLVAIAYDGTLLGVQVLEHNETPGLGDAFETRDKGWLDRLKGRSLVNPAQQRWSVRKDGGEFDAFTGATITPRAIVNAVRRALEFHALNRESLYAARAADGT